MLHTLKGNGFDCLFTLVSIKMEHPRPLQVCTNVCIIFAHTGAGVIRVKLQDLQHVFFGSFNIKKIIVIQHLVILCVHISALILKIVNSVTILIFWTKYSFLNRLISFNVQYYIIWNTHFRSSISWVSQLFKASKSQTQEIWSPVWAW